MARAKKTKPEAVRAVGRPRTTVDDLPEGWKDIMREIAQNGGSAVECQATLGVYNSAWQTLLADSEEFRETVSQCKIICQVWWERVGRELASGQRDGNAVSWIFNMKNRFDWKDKAEVQPAAPFDLNSNQKVLSRDELIQQCKDKGIPLTMLEKVIDNEN